MNNFIPVAFTALLGTSIVHGHEPDLAAESIRFTPSLAGLSGYATFRYSGDQPLSNVTVKVQTANFPPGALTANRSQVSFSNSGDTASVSFFLRSTQANQGLGGTIIATIDPDNIHQEIDEFNNVASISGTIPAPMVTRWGTMKDVSVRRTRGVFLDICKYAYPGPTSRICKTLNLIPWIVPEELPPLPLPPRPFVEELVDAIHGLSNHPAVAAEISAAVEQGVQRMLADEMPLPEQFPLPEFASAVAHYEFAELIEPVEVIAGLSTDVQVLPGWRFLTEPGVATGSIRFAPTDIDAGLENIIEQVPALLIHGMPERPAAWLTVDLRGYEFEGTAQMMGLDEGGVVQELETFQDFETGQITGHVPPYIIGVLIARTH